MNHADQESFASAIHPYSDEEQMFRESARRFLDRELDAHYQAFEAAGEVPRSFWAKAGAAGLLGPTVPVALGGAGGDPMCYVVFAHELGKSLGYATVGNAPAGDLLTELLAGHGSSEQLERWLPRVLSGELLQCLAVTEPGAGSDVVALSSRAVRDGEYYVVSGAKTFITNGGKADLLYVLASTDSSLGSRGLSLFIIEADCAGITRRPLKTLGFPAYDVAELHFDDVRVPARNLIGEQGQALKMILTTFRYDRLVIAAHCLGQAELAFDLTVDHCQQRQLFGKRLIDFQNTKFQLAEMRTQIETGRSLLNEGVRRARAGVLTPDFGSIVKLFLSEMVGKVADACLQLFGGAGFMNEMPISRIYTAARVQRIYGGASEIQRLTIARTFD